MKYLFSFLALIISCSPGHKRELSMSVFQSSGNRQYMMICKFDSDDIEVLNWSDQKFKIINKNKIMIVDSAFRYNSTLNSHLKIFYDNRELYEITLVPKVYASLYNYKLPYLYFINNYSIFSDSGIVQFDYRHEDIDSNIIGIINGFASNFL